VLQAKPVLNNEPFAVILADDLTDSVEPVLAQLIHQFTKKSASVIAIENIPKEKTFQYGIVDGKSVDNKLIQINTIIEKPKPEDAPSTMGVIGRYIFSPLIIDLLEKVKPGKSGEIQLTDAIQLLLNHESVYAYNFEGIRYDCGDKLGFMKANIEFSKKHPEIGSDFVQYLKSLS